VHLKLKENDIDITGLYCGEEAKKILEKDSYVKRAGLSTFTVDVKNKVFPKFPALIISIGPEGTNPHIWCCTSWEMFSTERKRHLGPGDSIPIVANIEKASAR